MTTKLGRMIVCVAFALGGALYSKPTADDQILAEYKTRSIEIQKKILASDSIEERIRLQAKAIELNNDLLGKVSAEIRPMLEISINVVGRLQADGQRYTEKIRDFFAGPDAEIEKITEKSAIEIRLRDLEELNTLNEALIARFDSLESEIIKTLDAAKVPAQKKRDFLAGFRANTGRKLGPVRAIRALDRKLYIQWREQYLMLRSEWGKWRVSQSGIVEWENGEVAKRHAVVMAEVDRLAELQGKAEAAMADRL